MRKRAADKQLSRGGRDSDDEPEVTTPQIATAEIMATRRVLRAKRPTAPPAEGLFRGVDASKTDSMAKLVKTGFKSPTPKPVDATNPTPSTEAPPKVAQPNAEAVKATAEERQSGKAATTATTQGPTQAAPTTEAPPKPKFSFTLPAGSKPFSVGARATAPPLTTPPATSSQANATAEPAEASKAGKTTEKADFDTNNPLARPAASMAPAKFSFGSSGFSFNVPKQAATFSALKPSDGSTASSTPAEKFSAATATTVMTGEEGETVVCEGTLYLYRFRATTDGSSPWVEAGSGHAKVNVREDDGKKRGRLLMRSATTKVEMLNVRIDASFKIAKKDEKLFILTSAASDGTVTSYLLREGKSSKPHTVEEFLKVIVPLASCTTKEGDASH